MALNVSRVDVTKNSTLIRLNLNNASTAESPIPSVEWSLFAVVYVTVAILGFLLNGTTLLAFLTDRTLHTPFNFTVMHLMALNVVSALLQYAISVPGNLYHGQWLLGELWCDLYLFGQNMVNAAIVSTHGLIAVNRAWAILNPISYRDRNSRRLTMSMLLGLWVFLLLVNFPHYVITGLVYRLPTATSGCKFNNQPVSVYAVFLSVVVYTIPILLVLALFLAVTFGQTFRCCREKNTSARLPANNQVASSAATEEGTNTQITKASGANGTKVLLKAKSRKYLFLSLLTASVVICYLPRTMFAFLSMVTLPNAGAWLAVYLRVANLLYACEVLIDPLLFVMTLDKLRRRIGQLFRRG
ncbi:hypothetical protein BV898_17703 [Hypsibius exemplaris]|uniref:G-protein coupled receptors family 1 profile domain-containing protein n=1 Tax=Hypsibius exemplaris TaxID=2072580 RepID=A0A9X6RME3_HYPEX|nr:hypothetical protein BV898_17703 [Hypsibius exemplaris]